jgi:hypothetical protein
VDYVGVWVVEHVQCQHEGGDPVPEDQPTAEAVRRLDEVAGHLSNLAEVLEAEEELGRVLQRSVDQITSTVPGADMVSVTVLRDGQGETAAASDHRVWDIDQDQYAAGDGPCLEAARTRKSVRTGVSGAGGGGPSSPAVPVRQGWKATWPTRWSSTRTSSGQ